MSAYDEEILLYSSRDDVSKKELIEQVQSGIVDLYRGTQCNPPTFQATVKVNKMDPCQKEHSTNDEASYNRNIRMAYLKVINVPTISDINYNDGEPNKNSLIIDYVDDVSYEIERQELEAEKDRIKSAKIPQLYEALKSIHVYLHVGEISVLFGKSKH